MTSERIIIAIMIIHTRWIFFCISIGSGKSKNKKKQSCARQKCGSVMGESKAVISHLTPEKDKQSHDEKEEV